MITRWHDTSTCGSYTITLSSVTNCLVTGYTGVGMAFYVDPKDYWGSMVSIFFTKLRAVMAAWVRIQHESAHPDDRHREAIKAKLLSGRAP